MSSIGLPACLQSLSRPPTGPIPADALVEVPYPPPPAQVEAIPPRKNDRDVWVEGQWDWDGTSWKWVRGAWQAPPSGAYFTPWQTVRRSDGKLYFAAATWRLKDGRPLSVGSDRGFCPPMERGVPQEAKR